MELNFAALIKCFMPIIFLASKIGLGTSVLITSNISKGVILNRIELKLNSESEYNSLFNKSDDEISNESITEDDIFSFIDDQRTNIPFEKILREALNFYLKTSEVKMSGSDVKEISAKAWENEKEYYASEILDSGMRADGFGIFKMHSDTFFDTAKNTVGTISLIPIEKLKADGDEAIDYAVQKFGSRFSEQVENSQFKEFIDGLKEASKTKIRELRLDDNSIFFKGHIEDGGSEEVLQIDEINGAQGFIDFLNYNMNFEQSTNVNQDTNDTLQKSVEEIAIPVINEKKFKKLLASSTSTYEDIKAHLVNIDEHPESAHQLAGLRGLDIFYGLEDAIYPKFMVTDLIKADRYEILQNLCTEHGFGLKSVFAIDHENIFLAAFGKNENKFKWFKLLISSGFNLKVLHQKALIKEIIENDDEKFLELLLKNGIVSLWEYIKDRGITLFHLILIEQKTKLIDYIIKNEPISKPDMKIQFVPNYDDSNPYSSTSATSYWRPSFNNFKTHFPNFIRPEMCIKKNWDSLMIAALTDQIEIFKILIKSGADTSGYLRIKPFLFDQGNNISLMSVYVNEDGSKNTHN